MHFWKIWLTARNIFQRIMNRLPWYFQISFITYMLIDWQELLSICMLIFFFKIFLVSRFFFHSFENENSYIMIYGLCIQKLGMSFHGPECSEPTLKIWRQSVHKWRRYPARGEKRCDFQSKSRVRKNRIISNSPTISG